MMHGDTYASYRLGKKLSAKNNNSFCRFADCSGIHTKVTKYGKWYNLEMRLAIFHRTSMTRYWVLRPNLFVTHFRAGTRLPDWVDAAMFYILFTSYVQYGHIEMTAIWQTSCDCTTGPAPISNAPRRQHVCTIFKV